MAGYPRTIRCFGSGGKRNKSVEEGCATRRFTPCFADNRYCWHLDAILSPSETLFGAK
jgi:hypothetical protein